MLRKLTILLIAIASASCSHNLFVIDENGKPIPDAQIRPLARSITYNSTATGEKGSAFIRKDHPPIESLLISKKGYITPSPVNFGLPKPITVVLKKK